MSKLPKLVVGSLVQVAMSQEICEGEEFKSKGHKVYPQFSLYTPKFQMII